MHLRIQELLSIANHTELHTPNFSTYLLSKKPATLVI